MPNNAVISESLFSAISLLVNNKIKQTRVATAAVVTAIYDNNTVDVQPIVKETINTKTGKQVVKLPEFKQVPYISSSNFEVGAYCVCLHLDRSLKGTRTEDNGITFVEPTSDSHNIGDCIAIISNADLLPNYSTTKVDTGLANI